MITTKPKVMEADLLAGMKQTRRTATPVDWLFAPGWLTIQEACELSGWDITSLLEIVAQGGVDLDDTGLIGKQSLYEFQEALAEVLH